MDLVDTHCHIQSIGQGGGERQTHDLWAKAEGLTADGVITAAREADVNRLICVGCDPEDSRLAVDFVQSRDDCWAAVGIHPHEARHFAGQAVKLHEFAALAKASKVVAVGECGLDFFYNHSPKAAQLELLKFQLELALKHDLPLIFHVRQAFGDFWPVFDSYQSAKKPIRGVLHSFTDSAENLAKALARDLFIGVNGIATFAKNPEQLAVYRAVPLQKLLLETDAPFLTPVPYRGSINEPKRVGTIAQFMAELRGENRESLAAVTTANARHLFGI